MMQRNEAALLEPWILYYADLFGLENLEIIDHGSDDPWVLSVLVRYERRGLTVHRHFADPKDFLRKGEIVQSIIAEWDRTRDYDFALPVDCDEFIVFCGGQITSDPGRIHFYLDYIRDVDATFQINRTLLNVPDDPGFFLPQAVGKSLIRRGTIVRLDNGFHLPVTIHERRLVVQLGIIHLHNRSFSEVRRFAEMKLATLIDVADHGARSNFDGEGRHLLSYFEMNEQFYLWRYARSPAVYLPSLLTHFQGLGVSLSACFGREPAPIEPARCASGFLVRVPDADGSGFTITEFEEATYLGRYPELGETAPWLLAHYLDTGYKEQRVASTLPARRAGAWV